MDHLTHWDDIDAQILDRGPLQGRRQRLAAAVGPMRLGCGRIVLGPGEMPFPPHTHADEDELFFVLAGSATALVGNAAHRVGVHDCLFYPSGGEAHAIVAGPDGCEVIAVSEGSRTSITYLPRSKTWWMGSRWLPADGPNPFRLEAELGPVELPEPGDRPPTTVNLADVEGELDEQDGYRGVDTRLSAATGARRIGIRHVVLEAGQLSCPPHYHHLEDELFVVLDGTGEAWRGDERAPIRPGSVFGCPANERVAHALQAGPDGLTYLAIGHDVANEICQYPRSGKVHIAGGTYRLTAVDYYDGE